MLLIVLKSVNVDANSVLIIYSSQALTQTLRGNRHLPSHLQDKRSVISQCSELIAKFEVLAKMQVLSIGERDLESSRRCGRQLEYRGKQLRIEYDQAQSCLDDFC